MGRGELAEAVALGSGFGRIEFALPALAARFYEVLFKGDHGGRSQSEFSKVVDAVFPDPVDTFGGFVAEVVAAKVAAEKEEKTG